MAVAFDSDVLSLLLRPETEPPNNPATGKPTTHVKARLDLLVSELQKAKAKIIIPAPALGEFLVVAGDAGPDYLTQIDQAAVFRIESFNAMAASESAALTRQAIHEGNKKLPASGHWQCIKTDRQIVAICRAIGVSRLYSNDSDMKAIAAKAGLEVVQVHELPIPPADAPLLAMMQRLEDETEVPPAESEADGFSVFSSESEQHSEQSPDVEKVSTPKLAHDHQPGRRAAQGPQQQGSSAGVPPHPPSTE